jgi:hypothetical protein
MGISANSNKLESRINGRIYEVVFCIIFDLVILYGLFITSSPFPLSDRRGVGGEVTIKKLYHLTIQNFL